jgi:hypothetical protein
MDEVIDLGAVADRGVGDRAPVDGRIRADLHVIADHEAAQRMDARPALRAARGVVGRAEALARGFHMGLLGRDEGKPVAAEDRAGLDDDAVADAHARGDADTREDQGVVADPRALGDADMGGDTRVGSDPAPGPIWTKGPMAAPAPISAEGSITAEGCMPGAMTGPGIHRRRDVRHGVARARRDDRGLSPSACQSMPGPRTAARAPPFARSAA